MKELIPNRHGITSLEIAEVTGRRHDNVIRDIRNLLKQGVAAPNFEESTYKDANQQSRPCFNLSPKGCLILASGYNVLLREKIINRLEELEVAKQEFQIPQTYSEALLLAANQAKEIENLQHENKQLVSENQRNQPKAEFADCIMQSEDCISIGEMANILKQNGLFRKGQNAFFEWLRYNGYLICRGVRYNLPTQKSMNRGLMKIAERPSMFDGGVTINRKAVVTPLGQKFFIDLFRKIPNNVFTPNGLFG